MWNCVVPSLGQYSPFASRCHSQLIAPLVVSTQAWEAHFVLSAHKVNQGSVFAVSARNSKVTMRNALKRPTLAVDSQRALQREALHELDDGQIVMRHLAGEPQAFGTLVDRYQTRLLNFVNRTIGDRERAEDLVQEVFIRVFRHLHRFDQTKKFSTWIYTIASNLAKNELRNRSRNPLVLFQTIKKNWEADHRPLQFEDTTARPDDLYRKRFLKDAVDQCVQRLPEHHREVFVLRELEGKSYQEIAEITGCNLGTVKSRLNRARNSFAQLIGPILV